MECPAFQNESPADFSLSGPKPHFQKALDEARGRIETLRSSAPFREAKDVAPAVAQAKSASEAWSRSSIDERASLLFRLADLLRTHRLELAALIVLEVRKNWGEADADVCEAIDFLEYYGREALRLEPTAKPLGVVAVISPWNFPLAILTGMTAAALVCSNTVVMKPAEQSPAIAKRLFDLFADAGIPEGVLQFLPGHGETVGNALVRHPDVSLVCFTGSKEVGMKIASLKERAISEMGGKNAIIVDESADLDLAAEQAKLSAFGFQGQKCSACSRVILLPKVYEPFKERFLDIVSKIQIGPPEDPENFMGPVIDDDAFRKINAIIETGGREAKLLYRGESPSGGWFIAPTVFDNVPPSAAMAQEEIFGPVVCLMKAPDLEQALKIAHGVPYDLTGGFFSRAGTAIERMKQRYEVGNLYINRKITGALVACQPFGGYRVSSLGFKAGGPEYLRQFVQLTGSGRPPEIPSRRELPSAAFQPQDKNQLLYIKEGVRWLGKTICERLTSS